MTVPVMINGNDSHGPVNDHGERKVVGALACQHDTYLKAFSTTVYSCEKNGLKKAPKDETYEIQLLDTILFPEGGGQPWDHGTLTFNEEDGKVTVAPIRKVLRRKLEAIHYSPEKIAPGAKVDIQLDFERRFDHAQQHSGQHLLSAVLDTYDIPTLAWSMGPDVVYIEVGRLPVDLVEIEKKCNEHIRNNLAITVKETRDVPDTLPADYDTSAGVIRIVSIGGIDANPCCGTHVKSTAELNSITILHTTTVPSRGTFRIHFVVGGRCQKLFSQIYANSRDMASTLSSGIDELPKKVVAMQSLLKDTMKKEKSLRGEMVAIVAEKLNASLKATGKGLLLRTTPDIDFLNFTLSALPSPLLGLVVMIAGDKDGGFVIVAGDAHKVKELSDRIKVAIPAVKGGGKPSKFQGKANTLTSKDLEFLRSLIEE
jgi:misacylated tRNA(Ala) deacylase